MTTRYALLSPLCLTRTSSTSMKQVGIQGSDAHCRRLHPDVQRDQVRNVVRHCRECQSIDPAPTRLQKGELGVTDIWDRVSMDICHARNQLYLTLIDCGPTRYAIWRRLRRQDAICVIEQLESVFYERGAPRKPASGAQCSAILHVAGAWLSGTAAPTFHRVMEYLRGSTEQ